MTDLDPLLSTSVEDVRKLHAGDLEAEATPRPVDSTTQTGSVAVYLFGYSPLGYSNVKLFDAYLNSEGELAADYLSQIELSDSDQNGPADKEVGMAPNNHLYWATLVGDNVYASHLTPTLQYRRGDTGATPGESWQYQFLATAADDENIYHPYLDVFPEIVGYLNILRRSDFLHVGSTRDITVPPIPGVDGDLSMGNYYYVNSAGVRDGIFYYGTQTSIRRWSITDNEQMSHYATDDLWATRGRMRDIALLPDGRVLVLLSEHEAEGIVNPDQILLINSAGTAIERSWGSNRRDYGAEYPAGKPDTIDVLLPEAELGGDWGITRISVDPDGAHFWYTVGPYLESLAPDVSDDDRTILARIPFDGTEPLSVRIDDTRGDFALVGDPVILDAAWVGGGSDGIHSVGVNDEGMSARGVVGDDWSFAFWQGAVAKNGAFYTVSSPNISVLDPHPWTGYGLVRFNLDLTIDVLVSDQNLEIEGVKHYEPVFTPAVAAHEDRIYTLWWRNATFGEDPSFGTAINYIEEIAGNYQPMLRVHDLDGNVLTDHELAPIPIDVGGGELSQIDGLAIDDEGRYAYYGISELGIRKYDLVAEQDAGYFCGPLWRMGPTADQTETILDLQALPDGRVLALCWPTPTVFLISPDGAPDDYSRVIRTWGHTDIGADYDLPGKPWTLVRIQLDPDREHFWFYEGGSFNDLDFGAGYAKVPIDDPDAASAVEVTYVDHPEVSTSFIVINQDVNARTPASSVAERLQVSIDDLNLRIATYSNS